MKGTTTFAAQAPSRAWLGALMLMTVALLALPGAAATQDAAFEWDETDPRIGLGAGYLDAESAAWNMEHLAHLPRPEAFVNPDALGDLNFANSDMGFQGNHLFLGNFHGFMIYDISDPADPQLEVSVVCPGGQGDISVYGNLVFMSVEQTRGRVDCGTQGVSGPVSAERFRGVRIFDISDLHNPVQIAAVQTCRGSHTHTILDDPNDDENLYVYVSGTAGVRSDEELPGCSGLDPDDDPETALFRIEVIQVPLDAPEEARVLTEPRVFADRESGQIDGLWPGGPHGEGTQSSARTNHCHDITIYPELGMAAGACSGNGILLDVTDPVNPVRTDEVIDENFAYWHSATFNNDGTTVIFTDEWGGGTSARCRATDLYEWGANAIFRIGEDGMERASYYKLPVPQADTENCVAHNGSLVPVPGRDIKVQAWYQGGVSVFDFTDPENPFEIAFFDRGPMSDETLMTAGYWSTYWYNGYIYGSEIARGLDVFELTPNEHLSEAELEAARLVTFEEFNPQHQPRLEWPANSYSVPRSYLDQLERNEGLPVERVAELRVELERIESGAEASAPAERLQELADGLEEDRTSGATADPNRVEALERAIRALAGTMN